MPIKKQPVKLAIVDDHNLFRKGLRSLISLADRGQEYLVVFEAESGQDMINKLDKKALPEILLMDIDMPDMDGFEAVAWLRKHFPQVSILIISMVETEEAVTRMLRMGVKGYLSKDIEVEDIYQALKAIATAGHYYTDFLTGKLIGSLQADVDQPEATGKNILPAWERLNESERKFLTLACTTDLPYEEIAGKMFLSIKTVEGYRRHVFAEFNVKNRIGMMLYAIRNHLVDIIPDKPAT